jgi:sodium/bile acid cotransporter 7
MIANNKCDDIISEEADTTTSPSLPPSSSSSAEAAAAAELWLRQWCAIEEEAEAAAEIESVLKAAAEAVPPTTCIKRIRTLFQQHSFLILITFAILLAYIYPPLGAQYLASNITSDWIAVILIFFLSGLSIRSEEFGIALKRPVFNVYIQFYNFIVVSVLVYGTTRLLLHYDILPISLVNGMVICSCLPVTVSMVTVLTTSAHGDTAMSIFHAALGNVIGVFLSPTLIILYLGRPSSSSSGTNDSSTTTTTTTTVHPVTIVIKLVLRIIVPLFIGQIIRYYIPASKVYMNVHKSQIKLLQECILTFIVYCTFCDTFSNMGNNVYSDVSATSIILMIIIQGVLLISVMILAWFTLKVGFGTKYPKLVAMGLFGCTHKTVALGIPLISAMYSSTDPTMMGLYTLPLLVWHPMQLLFGSGIAPYVANYVDRREIEITLDRNNSSS